MAQVKRLILVLLVLPFTVATSHAALMRDAAFEQWLRNLEHEAVSEGVSTETAESVFNDIVLDDRVLELDEKQPETTIAFEDYIRRIVTPERIVEGRRRMRENAELLAEIAGRYGVQPEIIVALWGMESSFGKNSGDYGIVDSLVTLAYQGRRAAFFRGELINALRIIDQHHIAASDLRGSWAGAMGQCQFMPSTYLRFAASYSGGVPDIWDNTADVFASIANYAAEDGWRGDQGWGREVALTRDISDDDIGLGQKYSLLQWAERGVLSVHGDSLPESDIKASLIAPDGPDGRHFLVYDNFRALMRWNHSTFFATSVGLLADRIK
jgi:membrane-bound lytic murein transglycosylase B